MITPNVMSREMIRHLLLPKVRIFCANGEYTLPRCRFAPKAPPSTSFHIVKPRRGAYAAHPCDACSVVRRNAFWARMRLIHVVLVVWLGGIHFGRVCGSFLQLYVVKGNGKNGDCVSRCFA